MAKAFFTVSSGTCRIAASSASVMGHVKSIRLN
jgi:hypothetical protein